jgi:uncharacterized tellurite resistance protein B-like protein
VLKTLTELFDSALKERKGTSEEESERVLNLATAVLLVEVARADYAEDVTEDRTIAELLRGRLALGDDEIALLVAEARAESDQSASLQEFTRTLHEQLTVEEKHQIIEMLWRVALADEHLDKHEDHLIRKIAGLLYVSHSDVIRLRNRVYSKYE